MSTPNIAAQLKRLLLRSEDLERATEELSESGLKRHPRVVSQHAQALVKLKEALKPSRLPDILRDDREIASLSVNERVLLIVLLSRKLRLEQETATGRELLRHLIRGSSGLLELAPLLTENAPLLKQGFLAEVGDSQAFSLDQQFTLGPRALNFVKTRSDDLASAEHPKPKVRPFFDATEHLMVTRDLVILYGRRAATLFRDSYWSELYSDESSSTTELTAMIDQLRAEIRAREECSIDLEVVRFRQKFGLREEEELVIHALLLQELYGSAPLLDAAELVRLTSGSITDVLRFRNLLVPGGHLHKCGLILLDRESEEKWNLNTCSLPDWVVDRLAPLPASKHIDSSECQRFRAFLQEMEGSDDFFKRL